MVNLYSVNPLALTHQTHFLWKFQNLSLLQLISKLQSLSLSLNHREAFEPDHGAEIHIQIAPTPSQEMREGGEIREVEDQESHGERQHQRSLNLRRECNPETHRADELSSPRLSPRHRHGPSRHAGEDVHNFKFSKLWLDFFTKKLCLVAGKTMEKKKLWYCYIYIYIYIYIF